MSHLSEFMERQAVTPGPRKGINSAWDCYTTASKTARVFRSVAKSVNRQISYAADLIAANEEMEHPETLDLITNTEWTVYRVSPLWNMQYSNKKARRGAANESDFTLGDRIEYDESALKRYAGVLRSYLLKDSADAQDNPSDVVIKSLKGLRGSRNDKDALKIEVYSVLGELKRCIFVGILCGVEVSELQISSSNATCLPVFLTNGPVDVTDRVIFGLTKCFECVISHLLFPKYELLYAAALWTGLEDSAQNTTDIDCSIQPKRPKRQALKETRRVSNQQNESENASTSNSKNTAKKNAEEMTFIYKIPSEFPEIRKKISNIKISLSFAEVKDLWMAIHDSRENTVTEQEMEVFHKVLSSQIRSSLGFIVETLDLETIRLPHISIAESGKIRILERDHVKIVLRVLTAMCHGSMLVSNPSLGIAEDTMGDQ